MLTSSRFVTSIYICLLLAWKRDEVVASSWLAQRVITNPVVVRRLLSLLRDAGLVQSTAGTNGGYTLALPAESISLWDISEAIKQRELYLETGFDSECPIGSQLDQILEPTFLLAEMTMGVTFEQVTLAELVGRLMPRFEASAA